MGMIQHIPEIHVLWAQSNIHREKTKTNKTKKIILTLLSILFALIFIFTGTISSYKFLNDSISRATYRAVQSDALKQENEGSSVQYEGDEDPPPFEVDFEELWKTNEDVVAWVYIPCIECSYPIMYSGDNDYYVHRDINKNYLFSGSLFMDRFCNPNFNSPNTVIYGHNMLNGSMFGILWYIPDKGYADEYPYFWVFTPGKTYRYKIFTAFETDKTSEAFKVFSQNGDGFEDWCFRMRNYSYIDTGSYIFNNESKIVTLTTCGANSWYRIIVSGIREKEYDTRNLIVPEHTLKPDENTPREIRYEEIPDYDYDEILRDPLLYKCFALMLILFLVSALIVILTSRRKTRQHPPDDTPDDNNTDDLKLPG